MLPTVFKATIEMRSPARIPIEQNIPVSNSNDKEANIKILVEGQQNIFNIPQTIKIKGKSTGMLPIKFSPNWKGNFQSKVSFTNPNTGESYEYTVRGLGEDPLAENHFKLK